MSRLVGIAVSPAMGVILAAFLFYYFGFVKNVRLYFILFSIGILTTTLIGYYAMLNEHAVSDFIAQILPFLGDYSWVPAVLIPALAEFGMFFAVSATNKRELKKGEIFTIVDIVAAGGLAGYASSKIFCAINGCCIGRKDIGLFKVIPLPLLEFAFMILIVVAMILLIRKMPGLPMAIFAVAIPLYWFLRSFFRSYIQQHDVHALEIMMVVLPLAVLYVVLVQKWIIICKRNKI